MARPSIRAEGGSLSHTGTPSSGTESLKSIGIAPVVTWGTSQRPLWVAGRQ
jgi:hypothetical protein